MSETNTKPGYKTTEFWLTALANVIGTLTVADIFPVESVVGKICAFAGMILANLGYTYSRSVAKKQ